MRTYCESKSKWTQSVRLSRLIFSFSVARKRRIRKGETFCRECADMAGAKIDLAALSFSELRALSVELDGELKKREDAEKAALIAEFENRAKASGFSFAELVAHKGKPAKGTGRGKGGSVPAKYRNPADPSETWAGRGRPPAWVKAHLEAGKALESLLIEPVKA